MKIYIIMSEADFGIACPVKYFLSKEKAEKYCEDYTDEFLNLWVDEDIIEE